MLKNIIISILAALLIVEWVPWEVELTGWEKAAVTAGFWCALIIFCFFCDFCHQKRRKYLERVSRIRDMITRLREGDAFGPDGK